jgi:putative DNA methylase
MSKGNNGNDDLRLIEDYLPIEAISAEASREKSVRKGHISTLHLWWARRPLVACRAAVYGALVPADRWVKDINVKNAEGKDVTAFKNGTKRGLNRKAAKEFVTKLCRYPKTDPTKPADIKLKRDTEAAIVEAQKHILEAHADRLTAELAKAKKTGKPPVWVSEFKFKGDEVTHADIVAGRAPRPRVLDMFAGGGAIPLEALRLGCEAYALDLNPVAHIIQLCTLVYPQKYGKPDPTARGTTGPRNSKGETTWGGLAAEVRYWGNWVIDQVRKEIGDLYPPIPDPAIWEVRPTIKFDRLTGQWTVTKPGKLRHGVTPDALVPSPGNNAKMFEDEGEDEDEAGGPAIAVAQFPPGFLQPIAYLWTRTVRCKNPSCGATVPLVRQTWLCKKADRSVALRPVPNKKTHKVDFEVVDVEDEDSLGFDPSSFSKGGNAACPFCGTVAELEYVKDRGRNGSLGDQLIGVVAVKNGSRGWKYLSEMSLGMAFPSSEEANDRISRLSAASGVSPPDESIAGINTFDNTLGITVRPYGLTKFSDLFTRRQLAFHLCAASGIKQVYAHLASNGTDSDRALAVATLLGCVADRATDFGSKLCVWNPYKDSGTTHAFGRQTITMIWDYSEVNHFNPGNAGWSLGLDRVLAALQSAPLGLPAEVERGSATRMPYADEMLDAVITDPPYYDNVPYADISDFFYVWLKRSVGPLYPAHFATSNTPKKAEAIADAGRHAGDWNAAKIAYEQMMAETFSEACRALKPDGQMAVVYAHKTTLGWSTLVEALRRAAFTVTEAWPLDTEFSGRLRSYESAALASSIFLVARKRAPSAGVGNYEDDVQPELQQIVRERVETLWEMGIAGADLVIACVGAGLRAFTKYEKVEYANGEEVPAEKFLAEVEGVVLDAMLAKLSGATGGNVSAVDNASRFYVLWRFIYKIAELDAGEAIVFSNGTHIELDGAQGLSAGSDALVEKKKAKYRMMDFAERGDNAKLGLPAESGQPASTIDVLHRILWLMENSPRKLKDFLDEARPDRERVRVLAQALAGAALSGKSEEESAKLVSTTPAEQAALGKLLANWRSLIESRMAEEEGTLFGKQGR